MWKDRQEPGVTCGASRHNGLAPDELQNEGTSNTGLLLWDENQNYTEQESSIGVSVPQTVDSLRSPLSTRNVPLDRGHSGSGSGADRLSLAGAKLG